ncbi:MAG: DUF3108 domain-containing protein [Ignavibacteria bacterium]|nr:DUF3108 domain-containing protein [Ignavibacteria bacterium]
MTHFVKLLSIGIVSFLIFGLNFSNFKTNPTNENSGKNIFAVGEDLIYEVKYTFIKIGEIRIKTLRKFTKDGLEIFETRAYIDSYDRLPFVDLHSIYNSQVSEKFLSEMFIGLDKHNIGWRFTKYDFDYKKKSIFVQKGFKENWKVDFEEYVPLNAELQDGLSLFFFARGNTRQNKTYDIPTYLNESTTLTTINFYKKPEQIKIDALDYDVDCVKIDGLVRFTGIFGLTGNFEGYFSNDEASVPIKATMKVILGNINIELKKWDRDDWQPPRKS